MVHFFEKTTAPGPERWSESGGGLTSDPLERSNEVSASQITKKRQNGQRSATENLSRFSRFGHLCQHPPRPPSVPSMGATHDSHACLTTPALLCHTTLGHVFETKERKVPFSHGPTQMVHYDHMRHLECMCQPTSAAKSCLTNAPTGQLFWCTSSHSPPGHWGDHNSALMT
jgi:hypothetical protein